MFNRTNKTDKRKQNNKGFSLVELIVVIAIMAVLVAVLAPQFTKYIDQSRKSNDAATVSGIVTAVQVGLADDDYMSNLDTTYTVKVTSTGTTISQGTTSIDPRTSDAEDKTLADAIKDSCGDLSKIKSTSKDWTEIIITFTVNAEGGVTVTYSSDFADYVGGEATPTVNPGTPSSSETNED